MNRSDNETKDRGHKPSLILLLILSILLFILIGSSVINVNYGIDFTEEFKINSGYMPIYNLQIIDKNSKCPIGTSQRQLGKFYGNVSSLSEEQKKLFIWKDIKFCTSIESPFNNYYSMLKYISSKCEVGTTNCGVVDTENHYLCLPQSLECPINYIGNNKNYCETNSNGICNEYKLINGNSIYYTNKIKNGLGKIYSNFIISDTLPCLKPKTFISYSNFPNSGYVSECPDYFNLNLFEDNYRYTLIDEQNKDEIYKNNQINLNQLGYTNLTNINTKLYGSIYIGYSDINLTKPTFEDLNVYYNNKYNIKFTYNLFYFIEITLIILVISEIIIYLMIIKCNPKVRFFLDILQIIISIVLVVSSIYTEIYSDKIYPFRYDIASKYFLIVAEEYAGVMYMHFYSNFSFYISCLISIISLADIYVDYSLKDITD